MFDLFARAAHRAQRNILGLLQKHTTQERPDGRYTRQGMEEGVWSSHALSKDNSLSNLPVFTNQKLSETHPFGVFMEDLL